jgi:hypothetical protein
MRFEVKTYNQSYHTNSPVQAKSMRDLWTAKHGKAIIIDEEDLKSWVESERPYYEIIFIVYNKVLFEHDLGVSSIRAISTDLDDIYDQIERYLYTLNTI